MNPPTENKKKSHGYAPINGLKMYYEIEGTGDPLVFIPPAFGFAGLNSFPALSENHSVISMDLQGHGRTADLPDRPISLGQHARDVVGLLNHLGVAKADFFGESYGGAISILIALSHPGLVRRVATWAATFGPPEVAHNPEMLRFDGPPTADSRCFRFQRESYRKVAPDPDSWPGFWEKMVRIEWKGFSDEELASVQAPVLVALGDRDFVRVEHALEAMRRIPGAELAVVPDAGHFSVFSERDRVIPIIKHFLEKPTGLPPVATAGMGYYPGETR